MRFDWFRKRSQQIAHQPPPAVDATLRRGVAALVAFLHANPAADDETVVQHLIGLGLSEAQSTKLIQFAPLAFTRFLYRAHGVRFAPDYVLLGPDGQLVARKPVADEPAYREAWEHCEEMAAGAAGDDYFVPIAARSGGYQAIQDLVAKGSNLSGIITGPPMMWQ